MNEVVEGLDLIHDVVDGDFLVLAREAYDQLVDAESNRLLLELGFPEETVLLDLIETLLRQVIQICVRVKRLDFEHHKRHGNDFLFLLLDHDLGRLAVLCIVTEQVIHVIVLLGSLPGVARSLREARDARVPRKHRRMAVSRRHVAFKIVQSILVCGSRVLTTDPLGLL